MNELLDWKHFSHPIEQSELQVSIVHHFPFYLVHDVCYYDASQDELLHWAASCITFVFQSEANSSITK